MAFLFILFVCSGCLLAALSIPLIMGKIGPNPWYGFRVKCTLSDPVVWYAVNAYSAKRLLAFGIAISISAVVLFFVPDIAPDAYAVGVGLIAFGGMIVSLIQNIRFLRSLP